MATTLSRLRTRTMKALERLAAAHAAEVHVTLHVDSLQLETTEGTAAEERFVCPLCGESAESFGPYGVKPRENARCPTCGSLERHRLLWLLLEPYLRGDAPRRLLHFAPEDALSRKLRLVPRLEYVTADLLDERADVRCDITQRTPWADGHFDLIICSHVLEHVDDDRAALRELRRLLADDGRAFILVPMADMPITEEDPSVTDPQERLRRFGQTDHVRRYGHDFVDRLTETGWAFDAYSVGDILPPNLARKYRCETHAGTVHVARKDP